ncbi:MAG: potassium channel family protein, partial [Archaeoglobaceae archaeon]|nr:potassium channel family protein [Archaeoglobaceae archaeon]
SSIAIILLTELSEGVLLHFLYLLDFTIAITLFYDYIRRVKQNGLNYALMNSYEIVAYIPIVVLVIFMPAFYGAILRALRILRFIALGIKLMKEVQSRSTKFLGSALLLLFLAIFFGSISFYMAESSEQNLDFFDCLYWAVITITTVGYGDIVPKSVIGKLTAMIIVFIGVAVISLFTASILSVMIERKGDLQRDLEELIKRHRKTAKNDDLELLKELERLLENKDRP